MCGRSVGSWLGAAGLTSNQVGALLNHNTSKVYVELGDDEATKAAAAKTQAALVQSRGGKVTSLEHARREREDRMKRALIRYTFGDGSTADVPLTRVLRARLSSFESYVRSSGDTSVINAEVERIVADLVKAQAAPLGGYRGAELVHGTPEVREARRAEYRRRYVIHAARLPDARRGQPAVTEGVWKGYPPLVLPLQNALCCGGVRVVVTAA